MLKFKIQYVIHDKSRKEQNESAMNNLHKDSFLFVMSLVKFKAGFYMKIIVTQYARRVFMNTCLLLMFIENKLHRAAMRDRQTLYKTTLESLKNIQK